MLVLIAPLDWGLGHATRCIPLIRALVRAGHTVVPCAGGAGARLLRAEFPDLTVEEIPGHAMTYTRNRALLPAWLLAQLPLYLLGVWREARAARRLARRYGAGLVIADGRYGFRAPGVPAVFVTHQLDILPPGPPWLRALVSPLLRRLNARALRGFTEIWVPDFAGPLNLSGALGHPAAALPPEAHAGADATAGGGPRVAYIRPLCRFRSVEATWDGGAGGPDATRPHPAAPPIDLLALVSGPEPQRTLFEKSLRRALSALPGTKVLVRGMPGRMPGTEEVLPGELNVFDHLPGGRLASFLESARSVVCRSGYTTMMELAGVAQSNVLLVPTPGQPEQEALARHARTHGYAAWQDQDTLDVEAGLGEASALPGFGRLTSGPEEGRGTAFTLAAWIEGHGLLRPGGAGRGSTR